MLGTHYILKLAFQENFAKNELPVAKILLLIFSAVQVSLSMPCNFQLYIPLYIVYQGAGKHPGEPNVPSKITPQDIALLHLLKTILGWDKRFWFLYLA